MTNLIPPDAKQQVKKEYWIRVVSVWGLLFALGCMVCAALLFPTFVLFNSQLSALETEISKEQNERVAEYKAAEEAVEIANEVANQLAREGKAPKAEELLRAVESVQAPSITVDSYAYEKTKDTVEHITISGTAADRTSLASFAEALKRNPYFTQAEVPISSLVRDSNLPFSITVVVAPPSKK